MKKIKRTLAFILAAVMLITAFSGCKKEETENSDPEFIYVPTYTKVDLPENIEWVGQVIYMDGYFYAITDVAEEVEVTNEETGETYPESRYVQKLITISADGKTFEELGTFGSGYVYTEEMEMSEYAERLVKTPNGPAVFVSKYVYTYDLPENFNPETMDKWAYQKMDYEYYAYVPDSNGEYGEGKMIFSFSQDDEGFYPSDIVLTADEKWYISTYNKVGVFDKDFNMLFEIDNTEGGSDLVELLDGRIGISAYGENGIELYVIDEAQKALGESVEIPENVYQFFDGNGKYDFITQNSSGLGLEGYNISTGEFTPIINWLDSDIDSSSVYPERVFIIDDENIITLEETWTDNGQEYNIINLKKIPYSEVPERKTITLAAVYLDYNLRREILEFNKTNTEYRIRPTDYSQYASGEDYAGITKLNTEIISGNIPDIFVTSEMPIDRYAGKGILEDLTPYIERDFGWDNLVEPFFSALKTEEGKLYEIYDAFSIQTYVGLKNVVGDGSGWTFDDLKEAYAKLPEGATVFGEGFTKDAAFYDLFANNIQNFVDWESGKCNFTSDEFIAILEFTENFPLEIENEEELYYNYTEPVIKVAKGEQLLNNEYIGDFGYFRARTFYALGDNLSFVGRPTGEGSGNMFNVYSGFAMSASCEHKDVAWEFISRILTEEYQSENRYNGIPTNKKVFDQRIEEEMTPQFDEFYDPEENGIGIAVPMPEVEGVTPPEQETPEEETKGSGFVLPEYAKGQVNEKGWHEVPKEWGWLEDSGKFYEFPVYAMTEAERDIILDLINNTTKVQRYDQSILDIVNEEVIYFFNGERTAQQTAEYIQSRVNIYVNEQR